KTRFVNKKLFDDIWLNNINYIIDFIESTYDMLRLYDKDKPCIHVVGEWWCGAREKVSLVRKKGSHASEEEGTYVNEEYANFSSRGSMTFTEVPPLRYHSAVMPMALLSVVAYGSSALMLQALALKLLMQSSTTSHCEKHLSTYSFMHSLKRNKMTPQHAKDLVFIHRNLYLLFSPRELQNTKERLRCRILLETFDSFEDVGDLEITNLSLDEPSWKKSFLL
ncbi:unnamed protein product, partial [Musa hybrid cultivar]